MEEAVNLSVETNAKCLKSAPANCGVGGRGFGGKAAELADTTNWEQDD